MKAVIVEIRGNHAAALSDDGIVRQVKNRRYEVGQEILMEGQPRRRTVLIRRCACAAAVFIIWSTSAWAYYTPYSYVSLDVNPSIEYTVNRFDRVLSCSAVNGDGAEIVDDLRLHHKNIQDAVSETIQKIADAGYFDGNEADIMIAASSKSNQKSEELAGQLKKAALKEAEEDNLNVNLEAVRVEQEYVQQARELGVTPGKLVLVNELQDSGSQLSGEEMKTWLDSPVKDLMKQIQQNKEEEKAASQNGQSKDNRCSAAVVNPGNSSQSEAGKENPKENPKENSDGNEPEKKENKAQEAKGNNGSKDTKANNKNRNEKNSGF